jgi:hypothetical protein
LDDQKNIDANHHDDNTLIMPTKTAESEQLGPKYPYYPLANALKTAEAVKDLGGARAPVKKSLLAKQLGAVEDSAAFAQQLASARAFGFLEGRGDQQLTELAKRYFFPTTESDKSLALLDAFSTPTAFAGLLKRFDGDRLPTREIISNIAHRELGVPESWKDRVAALFANSAQTVGVIDSQGFLRFDAAKHSSTQENTPIPPSADQTIGDALAALAGDRPAHRASLQRTTDWRYKSIFLQTPEDMDSELWSKLNSYIQVLKPPS